MLTLKIHHIDVGQADASLIVLTELVPIPPDGKKRESADGLIWMSTQNDPPLPRNVELRKGGAAIHTPPKQAWIKENEIIRFAVLIDSGQNPDAGEEVYKFCERKLTKKSEFEGASTKILDAIIISHHHADHINGLYQMARCAKAATDKIITSDTLIIQTESNLLDEQLDSMCVQKMVHPEIGMFVEYQDFCMKCIYDGEHHSKTQNPSAPYLPGLPAAEKATLERKESTADIVKEILSAGHATGIRRFTDDNISLAWIIQLGDFIYYTGGDANESQEVLTIASLDKSQKIHVAKLSHHGSRTPGAVLISKLHETGVAIINAGYAPTYNHPHMETLKNLKGNGLPIIMVNGVLDEYGIMSPGNAYQEGSGHPRPWRAGKGDISKVGSFEKSDENVVASASGAQPASKTKFIPYGFTHSNKTHAADQQTSPPTRRALRGFIASAITIATTYTTKAASPLTISISRDTIISAKSLRELFNADSQNAPARYPIRTTPVYIDALTRNKPSDSTSNPDTGNQLIALAYTKAAEISDRIDEKRKLGESEIEINAYIHKAINSFITIQARFSKKLLSAHRKNNTDRMKDVAAAEAEYELEIEESDFGNVSPKKRKEFVSNAMRQAEVRFLEDHTRVGSDAITRNEYLTDAARVLEIDYADADIDAISFAAWRIIHEESQAVPVKIRGTITIDNVQYVLVKRTTSRQF